MASRFAVVAGALGGDTSENFGGGGRVGVGFWSAGLNVRGGG